MKTNKNESKKAAQEKRKAQAEKKNRQNLPALPVK